MSMDPVTNRSVATGGAVTRPLTPDVYIRDWRGHRIRRLAVTIKRHCNRCDTLLGDVTHDEVYAIITGAPLPDVRDECPTCSHDSDIVALARALVVS